MSPIEIKGFDPNRLEELAKQQTAIYNAAIAKLPESFPAKTEDIIARFKRDTFDPSRMFYAYEGDRMVGYLGLSGKDEKLNERGIGYPWLVEGTDTSVRGLLFEAAEKKAKEEGIKKLRCFGAANTPEINDFFESKGYKVVIEFLRHEKKLQKNDIQMPPGFTIRTLKREDLPAVEEVSKNDPKMKSPFVAADFEAAMDSSTYQPDMATVAEKDNKIVGYHGAFIPPDPAATRAYFGGVAVHGDHQEIEPILVQEIENRVLAKGFELMDITLFPDSPRLKPFQELGYKKYSHFYRLEKEL
ncbi:MAG: GNAT family N-acetyltransferase [Candidatus Hodarchaeales archaeon]|jgi:GNAT superfamily N-acetyltransferase